jgi:ATP/maltotriose-dependent transcriptional regulator MalT
MWAASTSFESGAVELLAGDPAAAEREVRRDFDELERMGATYHLSTTAAMLAQAVAAPGRDEEAARLIELGLSLTTEEDVDSDVLLACVRSGLLTRRGEIEAGVAEAQRGLARLEGAEAPIMRAEALFALADACTAAGDTEAAAGALHRAAAECAEKGYVVAERRAWSQLDAVAG